jgi:hypothetical protein
MTPPLEPPWRSPSPTSAPHDPDRSRTAGACSPIRGSIAEVPRRSTLDVGRPLVRQLVPGPAATHTGRILRHDVRVSAGEFEGVHQGQLRGNGAVIVWDEGTAEILREEPNHLSFALHGQRLIRDQQNHAAGKEREKRCGEAEAGANPPWGPRGVTSRSAGLRPRAGIGPETNGNRPVSTGICQSAARCPLRSKALYSAVWHLRVSDRGRSPSRSRCIERVSASALLRLGSRRATTELPILRWQGAAVRGCSGELC